MAYGVIIYEKEHEALLKMSDDNVGRIAKNMIRAFRGEKVEPFTDDPEGFKNAYLESLCARVEGDKESADSAKKNGAKGGAPKGNQNAKKNKFTEGATVQTYDFQQIERKVVKN